MELVQLHESFEFGSAGLARIPACRVQVSPTGEPWLGPDILDHLSELNERGVDDVLVCPVGFVSDHLEIRWDIDVEAQDRSRELGMTLRRIQMPNADSDFVRALASLVEQEVGARAPR